KRNIVACLMVSGEEGRPRKEIRTFETLTDDLLKLADWLGEQGVSYVAMEATGVYWKPVWNPLEGSDLHLLPVNARHIKAGRGRKADGRACGGTPRLLRPGLPAGRFVPARPRGERRELTRHRTSLVRERGAEVNRLRKVLEGANIKLAAVASNVMGKSGRE